MASHLQPAERDDHRERGHAVIATCSSPLRRLRGIRGCLASGPDLSPEAEWPGALGLAENRMPARGNAPAWPHDSCRPLAVIHQFVEATARHAWRGTPVGACGAPVRNGFASGNRGPQGDEGRQGSRVAPQTRVEDVRRGAFSTVRATAPMFRTGMRSRPESTAGNRLGAVAVPHSAAPPFIAVFPSIISVEFGNSGSSGQEVSGSPKAVFR